MLPSCSLFGVAAVAGAHVGRWWFVSIVALTPIGLFLGANDDWYGAGWRDFGNELNLFAGERSP